MATATESAPINHLADGPEEAMGARTIPILTPTIQTSASSPGEPMEITTPTSSGPGSTTKSPESEDMGHSSGERPPRGLQMDHLSADNIIMPAPVAAAAAVHQPKIVQTAFIHKLYNMLEDKTIQHLISWTPSAESFVMQPSHEFSKVLAQYFKHTNISSFVRQLNMYGFHKVSDVFHHGTPESTLWEFKHGNGNFKRGDLVGLREIKRRASRHALVHREYNSQKSLPSQPGTPVEAMPTMQEGGGDPRMNSLEHTLYELGLRLQRSEENAHFMQIKQHAIMDTVSRVLQYSRDLSRAVLALAPNPENPIHQDVANLQGEIQRQAEMFRSIEEPHEPFYAGGRPFLSHVDHVPVSPRQLPQDDQRRYSIATPQSRPSNNYRPPVPSNLSISTRRPYGSIGATTTQSSPSTLRTQMLVPPPPPGPHPLANVELPPGSLTRRHTSADIRAHGWQPRNPPPPPSSQWPSPPNRASIGEDQRLRDSLSQYSLQVSSQPQSRPTTPPPPPYVAGAVPVDNFGSWSWNKASRGDNRNLAVQDNSAPPTRRGSMAHILNPTETAERDGEDGLDPRGEDDRKRKRLQ